MTPHASPHPKTTPAPAPGAGLWQNPNFRWLSGGSALSLLGDQFTLIALPWLVLGLSGDTRALGTVLALLSVPRALFILVGGALVDRHSPRRVLMLSKYLNLLLLSLLAGLVLSGTVRLWMVHGLALGIGLATAFSIPAGTALLPQLLPPAQLQAANGISLALRQGTLFLGPLLAGLLIAGLGDGPGRAGAPTRASASAIGMGLAFALDALSFALSAWTLAKVEPLPAATGARAPGRPSPPGAVLDAVKQGLAHCWHDAELRTCFLYWSAVALFIMGPSQIAVPVLADSLPQLGAAAFGTLLGAHGAGTLLGMLLSSRWPRLRIGSLGTTLLVADGLSGALFMPLGHIRTIGQGAALMLLMGLLGGYMQVSVFTWIQQRVPAALLGRAMSLFMFIFMGLAPLSAAATGWLLQSLPLSRLFMLSGGALLLLAMLAATLTPLRRLSDADTPRP